MSMLDTIKPRADQLNADDFIGQSDDLIITITRVDVRPNTEQPVTVFYRGDNGKPWKPGLSMRRVLVFAWGEDEKEYVGRSVALYREPKVKFGDGEVGGIRIRSMSHIDGEKTYPLTATRGRKVAFKVRRLVMPTSDAPKPQPAASAQPAPAAAMEAANNGTAAFGAWWKANPDQRAACAPHLADLKAACAEADAMDADPFGLPAASDIEAQVRAELAARDAAMEG